MIRSNRTAIEGRPTFPKGRAETNRFKKNPARTLGRDFFRFNGDLLPLGRELLLLGR